MEIWRIDAIWSKGQVMIILKPEVFGELFKTRRYPVNVYYRTIIASRLANDFV